MFSVDYHIGKKSDKTTLEKIIAGLLGGQKYKSADIRENYIGEKLWTKPVKKTLIIKNNQTTYGV